MSQQKLDVDFGIEREYVFDILTSDISVTDCILDLIDNSIDAARRDMALIVGGGLGLPDSYKGYCIELSLGPEKIEILDNCQGMEDHLLAKKAFRLGARHVQKYSIGIYGVGLIRAFWKLGNQGTLITDTGDQAYRLSFSKRAIQIKDKSVISALWQKSAGIKLNKLTITKLTADAKLDLSDTGWISYFEDKVKRVFGLCIRKGLVIKINGKDVPEFGPRIRSEITELTNGREFSTTDGVSVKIEVGVHESYLFSGDDGHSQQKNANITKEFGWYVVCNDRIVLIADLSLRVGWDRVWHSEYNGFIGWVYFVSEDAKLLPWDSSKTDISLEKRSQREVAPRLRDLSDWYRNINRNYRYPSPDGGGSTDAEKKGESKKRGDQSRKNGRKARKENPEDHNEYWGTLFPDVDVKLGDNKLRALVFEAKRLPLVYPYSGTILFRVIIERALNVYLKAVGKYGLVKLSIFGDFEESGRPFKEDAKRTFAPSLSQIVSWLVVNTEIFPDDNVRELGDALRKLRDNLKDINKIVHEGGLISSGKLRILRDDCWPLVKYLLETDPTKNG